MRLEFRGETKLRIVADWAAAFPTLGVVKASAGSPHLARRAGALIQGISLDRSGDPHPYRPTAFIDFLGERKEYTALTLATVPVKPNGAEMSIRAGLHDREYGLAVTRIREQFPLSFDEPLTLDGVLAVLRERILAGPGQEQHLAEMLVLLPALAGRHAESAEALAFVDEVSAAWPYGLTMLERDEEERVRWVTSLRTRAADPAGVLDVVREQIVRFNYTKIPAADLV